MKIKIQIICACLLLSLSLNAQDKSFSDAAAPVGNTALTVPSTVKPILDTWLRDTYITLGPDGFYYMTGTTATAGRKFASGNPHCWDYNDGIYLWRSKDMKAWQAMGLIWGFDKDAADWQKRGRPVTKGAKSVNGDVLDSIYRALWAPEIHYIKSKKKWLIAACLNGNQGSFVLESVSGEPGGPYKNIDGNKEKAIFNNIDLGLFEDTDGAVYLLGHNHFIARMKDDLSDVAEPFKKLTETPYNPEPYLEGMYIDKHNGKYVLMQTAWSVQQPGDTFTYLRKDNKDKLYSYDVVVAEADNIYGPYGPRYAAILQGGHNNTFQDRAGNWWSTTFFNPRGVMGTRFNPTCRPAVVPLMWVEGKLMPDEAKAKAFYAR